MNNGVLPHKRNGVAKRLILQLSLKNLRGCIFTFSYIATLKRIKTFQSGLQTPTGSVVTELLSYRYTHTQCSSSGKAAFMACYVSMPHIYHL